MGLAFKLQVDSSGLGYYVNPDDPAERMRESSSFRYILDSDTVDGRSKPQWTSTGHPN